MDDSVLPIVLFYVAIVLLFLQYGYFKSSYTTNSFFEGGEKCGHTFVTYSAAVIFVCNSIGVGIAYGYGTPSWELETVIWLMFSYYVLQWLYVPLVLQMELYQNFSEKSFMIAKRSTQVLLSVCAILQVTGVVFLALVPFENNHAKVGALVLVSLGVAWTTFFDCLYYSWLTTSGYRLPDFKKTDSGANLINY